MYLLWFPLPLTEIYVICAEDNLKLLDLGRLPVG